MNNLRKKKKKGFTLVELIAVVAILAILAAVAVPRVVGYVDKSKKVAIQTTASTIYNAAEIAYSDGKLKVDNKKFDEIPVKDAIDQLKSDDVNLLSSAGDVSKLGAAKTMGDLRAVMNANEKQITLNEDGSLKSFPTQNTDETQDTDDPQGDE